MGRNDLLLASFALPSFYFFLVYLEKRDRLSLAAHFALLVGALLTKESGVALPLVCFAYLLLSDRNASGPRLIPQLLTGWIGCIGMWAIARSSALQNPRSIGADALLQSASEALPALLQLSGKVVLPFNLSVLPTLRDTSSIFGIVAVLAVVAAISLTPRQRRWMCAFALVWILVFVLPSFVRLRATGVQHLLEHRMYLPSFGFILVLLESPLVRRVSFGDRRPMLVLAVVLALFSFIIVLHGRNFRDRIHFWESAARTSPSHPLALRNLGAMYFLDGDYDRAEVQFQRALELNPDEEMAENNLGLVYAQRGQYQDAASAFRREIEGNPSFADPYYNLAVVYLEQTGGRPTPESVPQLVALLERTLLLDPNHDGARGLLARLRPPSDAGSGADR
jgi:hypothetical protein